MKFLPNFVSMVLYSQKMYHMYIVVNCSNSLLLLSLFIFTCLWIFWICATLRTSDIWLMLFYIQHIYLSNSTIRDFLVINSFIIDFVSKFWNRGFEFESESKSTKWNRMFEGGECEGWRHMLRRFSYIWFGQWWVQCY